MGTGRFTLPGQAGMEKEIAELVKKWGVDAIRDSDGTQLSDALTDMGLEVYSTLCLVREDNAFAKANRDKLQQIYLLTDPVTATGDTLNIRVMEGFFTQQFEPDVLHDPKIYWEVMDRTTGSVVPAAQWQVEDQGQTVVISGVKAFHRYTVTFLAWQIWEPVSMYNHITNNWEEEHRLPVDPRHPEVRAHMLADLKKWLEAHPRTDIVRFTTFFYCFDLIYGADGKERQVDWFGYGACVSALAIEQFAAKYGYRPRPEDFVTAGGYNTPFMNPSRFLLDFTDFNSCFVAELAKECVDMVHGFGKKAIMFLGDHWAGTEPYGKYFQSIGLDAVVGAGGDGVTYRMISDIPVPATEARFYPYFFPDVFREGGDPVGEGIKVWTQSRRAALYSPTDRIGYGGYLSLALRFPDFVDLVAVIASQFRSLHDQTGGTMARRAPFKVAVLTAWGKERSWMTHQIAHSLWNRRCYSYIGVLEALAGLEFEVVFVSYDQIVRDGIPGGVRVILNMGDSGTSFSGAEVWADEKLQVTIRRFVFEGGAFLGIGEPTAHHGEGAWFQLRDVLGVDREMGHTVCRNKPKVAADGAWLEGRTLDVGEGMGMVYKCSEGLKVHQVEKDSIQFATHTYGKGRSGYLAGLPFSFESARLLRRLLWWLGGDDTCGGTVDSGHALVEVAVYDGAGKAVVVNNSRNALETRVQVDGKTFDVCLDPMGMEWIEI